MGTHDKSFFFKYPLIKFKGCWLIFSDFLNFSIHPYTCPLRRTGLIFFANSFTLSSSNLKEKKINPDKTPYCITKDIIYFIVKRNIAETYFYSTGNWKHSQKGEISNELYPFMKYHIMSYTSVYFSFEATK